MANLITTNGGSSYLPRMGLLDIIKGLIERVQAVQKPQPIPPAVVVKDETKSDRVPGTPPPIPGPSPDRFGSFIIPDIYPADLGQNPPFSVLPGKRVMDKEVIGCYVKCSEGLGWGKSNEDWFRRSWVEVRRVGGQRYGIDWFRGCYHFLRFQQDGAAQADYCLDLIESAGGWGEGDLMLWVDVEEGGQGSWAGGEKLELIKDTAKRARLAAEVTRCTTAFIARVKQRYPGMHVGLYGRGVFRDLRMGQCRFGADAVCNPAYTRTMPSMEIYGWPLEDVTEWQLCGDGVVFVPGYPSEIPGWGKTDYSAVIFGSRRVGLVDVRRRCLARPR